MTQTKGKSLLTDSQVRKIYESRLPEFRPKQNVLKLFYSETKHALPENFRNIIPRTIEEKRAIVYNMKAQYLNHKAF